MMHVMIKVDGGKIDAAIIGSASEQDVLVMIAMLDRLKHKLMHDLPEPGVEEKNGHSI